MPMDGIAGEFGVDETPPPAQEFTKSAARQINRNPHVFHLISSGSSHGRLPKKDRRLVGRGINLNIKRIRYTSVIYSRTRKLHFTSQSVKREGKCFPQSFSQGQHRRYISTKNPHDFNRGCCNFLHGRERYSPFVYFARGFGRIWKCTTSGFVPFPVSMCQGVLSPLGTQSPRPFQPARGSSMRPSNPFM